jgi:signal transduction histidine kinase
MAQSGSPLAATTARRPSASAALSRRYAWSQKPGGTHGRGDWRRWWDLGSVRSRATVAAAATVALALAVGGATLVYLVHGAELQTVRSDGRDELAAVQVLARQASPPRLLPAVRNTALVQVVSRAGQVVASSAALPQTPMAYLSPHGKGQVTTVVPALSVSREGPFLVYAGRVENPPGGTAYVAGSLRPVDEATNEVTRAVVIGGPLLVVLVGLLTWFLTARALAPVEAIRAEVEYISERALDRRVPQPDGDDEIGRLARTMNAMLERLDEAAARQRQFVSDSSHELRSPLAALLAQIEVALSATMTESSRKVLVGLRAEGERLERIIDDLLLLARADERSLSARRRLMDLDDLVLDEAARLRSRGLVKIDTAGLSAAQLFGDRDQLVRLVRNLLDNAERHARSVVTVGLQEDHGAAVLTVTDDGAGIPPEERERVFERFTRLDTSRERSSGGSGLGLAIARQIARAHDGNIEVTESEKGARFVVRLPVSSPGEQL